MTVHCKFNKDFIWGVATSSYQIEGATKEDGRGESIWDRFAAQKSTIVDQSDGSRACEHYTLWPQDIQLMKKLNVDAYRFSIAWPRILPQGRGAINQKGLDFYSRLVDGLLEAGITPWVTLYHWDLPQSLEDEGGWRKRQIIYDFANYTDIVTRHLGDRVQNWITHNEPWCASMLGYLHGQHAPGLKSWPGALEAAHYILLSHGRAVEIIRKNVAKAQTGITLNLCPAYPASQSQWDRQASKLFDGEFNRWFLDPLYGKGYPQDVVAWHIEQGHVPENFFEQLVLSNDLADISKPCDFLGINYYSRGIIRSKEVSEEQNDKRLIPEPLAENKTDIGWEVFSDGLYDLLLRVNRDYHPPSILITENGAAYHCAPDEQGRIKDVKRIEYLKAHIEAVYRACEASVPINGYFAWSLMDNFEWAEGYTQRFGLLWVDYETQQRLMKDSAFWYRDFISQQKSQ